VRMSPAAPKSVNQAGANALDSAGRRLTVTRICEGNVWLGGEDSRSRWRAIMRFARTPYGSRSDWSVCRHSHPGPVGHLAARGSQIAWATRRSVGLKLARVTSYGNGRPSTIITLRRGKDRLKSGAEQRFYAGSLESTHSASRFRNYSIR